MPGRNVLKEYIDNGFYHVYNRGVNKQDIFLDKKDYAMFLFYLKMYLDDPEKIKVLDIQKREYLTRKNFFNEIELLSYCLLSNHFHLLIKQKHAQNISEFMRCLLTNYSMYFNKRYNRVGPLFQGRYKAVLIKDDSYLVHLSRYIHRNPAKGPSLGKLWEYDYSSYADYLGKKNTTWLKPDFILNYFNQNSHKGMVETDSYEEFTEESGDSKRFLGNLILE